MAQKIVTLCDAHMAGTDDEIPAETWEVALMEPGQNRPTTWTVDLCEDHGKTLADLAVMLGAVGRVIDGPRKPRKAAAARVSTPPPVVAHTASNAVGGVPIGSMAPEPCPVDGCGKVPSTRKALMSHLRHNHDGMSLAKAYGLPEPYACPEPGCDFTASRPQGLGAHRTAAHGYRAGDDSAVAS